MAFILKGAIMYRKLLSFRQSIYISFWAGLLIFLPIAKVSASCGAGNCFLVTGAQEGISSPSQMTLDISYRYIPMDDFQSGSGSTTEVLTPSVDFENREIENEHHREVRTINELVQVDIGYGVTERFTLQLAIPLINNRTHEHYDGISATNPTGTFTREDSSSGIGDIRLIGRYAPVVTTRHLVVLGGGIKFPTGEYKLFNAEGTINEPSVQPGTGSTDYLFSVFYDYQIIPHKLDSFVSGSYQVTTENDLDYEFGDQTLFNVGLNYLLETEKKISVSGQLNFRQADRDTYETTTGGAGVPSTGSISLHFTPGIRIQSSDNLSLYSFLQLPIYQYVNEKNVVSRFGLVLGATYTF
ncbi:MAG: transporter [Nitrospiria bacterium]